jgi:hypothetical protein
MWSKWVRVRGKYYKRENYSGGDKSKWGWE